MFEQNIKTYSYSFYLSIKGPTGRKEREFKT